MVVAYISDRFRHRFGFIIASICISLTGFGMMLSPALNSTTKYGALFLITCGTYAAMPVIICWFNMNLGGHHRRAVGSAWQVGFGNIGGIIATYAFLPKDAPAYVPGYSICIAFVVVSVISCSIYFVGCVMANRKRERTTDGTTTEYEKAELGDLSPDYRYIL